MAIQETLLLAHLLAAAYWVGGMAVMHFAVRPAAAGIEPPPVRLRFMVHALGRMFAGVAVAIVLLFASGWVMVMQDGGWAGRSWSVHAMLAIALVMTAIFGWIRLGPFVALRRAVEAAEWPVGAARLALIRRLVLVNLCLGMLVFAVATLGRAF